MRSSPDAPSGRRPGYIAPVVLTSLLLACGTERGVRPGADSVSYGGWVYLGPPSSEVVFGDGTVTFEPTGAEPVEATQLYEGYPGYWVAEALPPRTPFQLRLEGEGAYPTVWAGDTPSANGTWLSGALFAAEYAYIDDLLVSQPDNGEQALEIVELLVRSNAVDLIVVDSVAALVPKAEIEGEMGDASMGLQARLMSQAMRKLTGVINRSQCTVVFINQIREKIGVMFGSPETTTGGRALKFYSSVRIDVRRTGAIKEGEVTVGSRTRARVVKNKIAPPFRDAEFDIMYDEGISASGDLLDLAVTMEVVQKSGSWFSYGDMRIAQGREAAKAFLKGNPELFREVRALVLAAKLAQNAKPGVPAPGEGDDDEAPDEE